MASENIKAKELSIHCSKAMNASQLEQVIDSAQKILELTKIAEDTPVQVIHIRVTNKVPGRNEKYKEIRYFIEYTCNDHTKCCSKPYTQSEIDGLLR